MTLRLHLFAGIFLAVAMAACASARPNVSSSCPAGTCRLEPGGPCEEPTAQLGNTCCECGDDGFCARRCRCLAKGTRVSTPDGEREISTLAIGERVHSLVGGRLVAKRLLRVSACPVRQHVVLRLHLSNGRVLEGSPEHPLADGRTMEALAAGSTVEGVVVRAIERVPYADSFTYDLLPDSPTGTFVAEGLLVGSTLRPMTGH